MKAKEKGVIGEIEGSYWRGVNFEEEWRELLDERRELLEGISILKGTGGNYWTKEGRYWWEGGDFSKGLNFEGVWRELLEERRDLLEGSEF